MNNAEHERSMMITAFKSIVFIFTPFVEAVLGDNHATAIMKFQQCECSN